MGRINKTVLISLLILSAIGIGHRRLSTVWPSKYFPQASQREQLQGVTHLQEAGTIADAPVTLAAWQLLGKPHGAGNLELSDYCFSSSCVTTFLQNKTTSVHAIIFVRQLLFPSHYFW
jgi:hypothetical protein